MKLAVGVRDVDELSAWQAQRASTHPPLRHRTRMAPRRRDEVLDGGSIYWVISGTLLVRQRILDIIDDKRDNGEACTALVLDQRLVPLVGRPTRPFQGWRYLDPDDVPPDQPTLGAILGVDVLPAALRRELRALCLI